MQQRKRLGRRPQECFFDVFRVALAGLLVFPNPLWANPSGGTVVGGAATLSNSGNTLSVNQSSNYAIINWNGFSINVGELTRFVQPSALSAVLNRVTGAGPSSINGSLQANGQVFLINPNGITVGPTGVINAQSFAASALDVSNDAFMAGGSLVFSGSSQAGVSNAGQINALGGNVLMIAHAVQNTGQINAAKGTAALAAGSEVLFSPLGVAGQHVFVQAGSGSGATGVDQQGQIQAATAELAAAGGNIYRVAINNSGVVRADAVQNQGGRIFLTATGGSVQNSGQLIAQDGDSGGSVQIVGDQITLQTGSLIDVSGANGGGTVLIGGGEHGTDPNVPDASQTTIEAGTLIDADALVSGSGGTVIVWSDDDTDFEGAITARGGALAGNGGFSEVSGGFLAFNGTVDLRAPNGAVGTLLLDPTDLDIVSAGGDGSCTTGSCSGNGAAPSLLSVGTLTSQLASSNVLLTADGNIDVMTAIAWSSGNSLTLTAGENIIIGYAITGGGALILNADGGAGQIQLNATGGSTGSPDISTVGGQTYNGAVVLGADQFLKETGGGVIDFEATLDAAGAGAESLTINSSASGDGASAGNITFAGVVGSNEPLDGLTVNSSGGAALLNGSRGNGGNGGSITFGGALDANAIMLNSTGGTANLVYETSLTGVGGAGGSVSFYGNVTGGSLSVTTTGGSGGVYNFISGNASEGAGGAGGSVIFGGAVTLDTLTLMSQGGAGGSISEEAAGNGSDINGGAGGAISFSGPVYAGVSMAVTSQGGNGGYAGEGTNSSGNSANGGAGGNILFAGAIDAGGMTVASLGGNGGSVGYEGFNEGSGHALNGGAGGSITFGGAVTATGGMTVNADGGNGGNLYGQYTADEGSGLNTSGGNGGSVFFFGDVEVTGDMAVDAFGGNGGRISFVYDPGPDSNGGAGGDISFERTVTVTGGALTVNGSGGGGGAIDFNDEGGPTSDQPGAGGAVSFAGALSDSGGAMTVSATGSGSLSIGGNVAFNDTVDSDGSGLTVDSSGNITFNGAVGEAQAFGPLSATVDGGWGGIFVNNSILASDVTLADYAAVNTANQGNIYVNESVDASGALNIIADNSVYVNARVWGASGQIYGGSFDGDNAGDGTFSFYDGGAGGLVNGADVNDNGNGTYGNVTVSGLNTAPYAYDSNTGALFLNDSFDAAALAAAQAAIGSSPIHNVYVNAPVRNSDNGALNVTAAGGVYLNAPIIDIGSGALALTADSGSGTIDLNADVTTGGGAQTYEGAVLLGGDRTLVSGGGAVSFASTVDAAAPGGASLTVDSSGGAGVPGGSILFAGSVGGGAFLDDLVANSSGGAGAAAGDIDFSGPVTLGGDLDLTALGSAGGSVALDGVVESLGGRGLSIDAGGDIALDAALEGLGSLNATVDGSGWGSIYVNGTVDAGAVSLTDNVGVDTLDQGNIYLNAPFDTGLLAITAMNSVYVNAAITAGSGSISGGSNDGGSSNGTFVFSDTGGSVNGGSYASQNFAGVTVSNLNGSAYAYDPTSGALFLNDSLSATGLGSAVTVDAPIYVNAPITAPASLESDSGGLTLNAPVAYADAGALSLTATAGPISLDADVSTGGDQAYNGEVVIAGERTVTSSGGDISFNGTVDAVVAGAAGLTVILGNGDVAFAAAVGSNAPLASLTLDGTPSATLTGSVTTMGAQEYDGAVTLAADAVLTGAGIAFASTVDGAFNLEIADSGETLFGAAVGGATPLASLTVDPGGSTVLAGGAVTTAGAQSYGAPVRLAADTVMTGDGISFASTVDGARNLSISDSGETVFGGAVGGAAPLASLSIGGGGTTALDGGAITTTGAQTYGNPVTLGADATLSGYGIDFAATVGGPDALSVQDWGVTTFEAAVGVGTALSSLSVGSGGTTDLAGAVTTTGPQTYGNGVVLGGAAVLAGDGITFAATVNGPYDLTIQDTGDTTFSGIVGGNAPLASLTIGGGGTTLLDGGAITTTGAQTYGNEVQLGDEAALTSTGGDAIEFDSSVDGAQELIVDTSGLTTFGAPVGGAAPLTSLMVDGPVSLAYAGGSSPSVATSADQIYEGPVTLNGDTILDSTAGSVAFDSTIDGSYNLTAEANGSVYFYGAAGAGQPIGSVTADAGSGYYIYLDGGSIRTQYGQTYNGAVELGVNNILESTLGGDIAFNSTVDAMDSNEGLTVETDGTLTFNGEVGSNQPLDYLDVGGYSAGTAGSTVINTDLIQTASGGQSYGNAVTLEQSATLADEGGGAIGFGSTLDGTTGAEGLTVETDGTLTFNGEVGSNQPLDYLDVGGYSAGTAGSTVINTDLIQTASGGQSYGNAVTLEQSATLADEGGGAIGFGSTLDGTTGAEGLTVETDGTLTFNGEVGSDQPLDYLDVGGYSAGTAGGTVINTDLIQTSGGGQDYGNTVTLNGNGTAASISLKDTAGGGVEFDSTVDGAAALSIYADGDVVFNGELGSGGQLTSLGVYGYNGNGPSTYINTDLIETQGGGQVYGGAVTLNNNGNESTVTLIDEDRGSVEFDSTLDGPAALGVYADGGVTFNGEVGTVSGQLTSLGVYGFLDSTTNIDINTDLIETQGGGQVYSGAVTLDGNGSVSLEDTGGGGMEFDSTVNGGVALSISADGNVTFNGEVGNAPVHLLYLNVSGYNGSGPDTYINTDLIETQGGQAYSGPVTLGQSATLSDNNGGAISFGSTLDGTTGNEGLTVETDAPVTFNGEVGSNQPLNYLDVSGYSVAMAGSTVLNTDLVQTAGGGQSYGNAVTLEQSATLADEGGGAISFGSTLDGTTGAEGLTAETDGTLTFNGEVGSNQPLDYLDVGGYSGGTAGSSVINTDLIQTASGGQSYGNAVTLEQSATLADEGGGAIGFGSTLDGTTGAEGLTVETDGTLTFNGEVGSNQPLNYLDVGGYGAGTAGGTVINTDLIQTASGGQSYGNAVTLEQSATLADEGGGAISFGSTLDGTTGAEGLTVETDGTLTFNGEVGSNQPLDYLDVGGYSAGTAGAMVINTDLIQTASGGQSYGNAVTLEQSATLADEGGGAIGFGSTLDGTTGAEGLTAETDGTLTFNGEVGSNQPLDYLDVGGYSAGTAGATVINTDLIRTSGGGQNYGNAVTLAGAETTLSDLGVGNIVFNGTVDGASALSIASAGGSITFAADVGAQTPLTSLLAAAGGAITIDPGVTLGVTGDWSDGGAGLPYDYASVLIAADNIAFTGAIASANSNLLLYGDTSVTLDAAVSLASLSVWGDTLYLDGGSVTTSGGQTYNGAVLLGANTVLAGSQFTLASTFDAQSHNLTLDFSDAVTVSSLLSDVANFVSEGGGGTLLDGNFTTSGSQTYDDAVTLEGDSMLSSSGGKAIDFASTVNGAQALTIATAGPITFGAAVGGTAALASLTTQGGGATAINGGAVTTTGGQDYGGAVTLGRDTVLTGGGIYFAGTLNGRHNLTISDSGQTTFGGAVGGTGALASLTDTSSGGIALDGSVTTSGGQTYSSAVELGEDATLTGGGIYFGSTIDGGYNLTIDDSGMTTFSGSIGTGSPLASLTVNSAAGTLLKATFRNVQIYTSGAQTFDDLVTLSGGGGTFLLSGTSLTLAAGLAGGRNSLTLDFADPVAVTSDMTNIQTFTSEGSGGTLLLGDFTTNSSQIYDNAVTLGGDVVLTASGFGANGVFFGSTLDGGYNLTVADSRGTITFAAAVGGAEALASLTVTPTGGAGIVINGGLVSTTGGQSYGGAVSLGDPALFETLGGDVDFGGSLNAGSNDLNVNAQSGAVTFAGAVSAGAITVRGGDVTWDSSLSGTSVDVLGTELNMNGTVNSSGAGGVLMVANDAFQDSGFAINTSGGGRFLIYSVSPGLDLLGPLTGTSEYGILWPKAPEFSGSGFLFSGSEPSSTVPALPSLELRSFDASGVIWHFDVPEPGAGTHEAGFFSIIESPQKNNDGK